MKTNIKFFWNGIKADGKLQCCIYSQGELRNYPAGTISIYKKGYERFSQGVKDAFIVSNDTDSMIDYFDTDTIRVVPTHRLYNEVKEAFNKREARYKTPA